jgi:iron(III) transport system substrate-binding protein
MRIVHGDDASRAWLNGVRALNPRAYPSNAPMLEALAAGEIDVAMTNHYYVLRMQDADGRQRVAIHHFAPGDVGNLALVTGAGILATAEHRQPAVDFISYLLSFEAQSGAASRVFEFPVLRGAAVPPGDLTFDDAVELGPDIDFEQLRDLDGTLRLLREVGLL